jgi:hypothetical protein
MANACIFCGDTHRRLTDEHVFGDWVSRFFIDELGVELAGTSELVNSDGRTRSFPMKPFQQRVKVVCKACNGGWMSGLEQSVASDLKVMIQGQPKMLRSASQRRLAFWCAKTALILDHLHPRERIIPDSHYKDLYNHQGALPDQAVLVAFRSVMREQPGELFASVFKQPVLNVRIPVNFPLSLRQQIEESARNGSRLYKVTFAVGNFAALVFGHNFPIPMNAISPRPIAKQIWPISPRFEWSRELSVDPIGGLPGFHAAFGPGDGNQLPENVPGQLPRTIE